MFEEEKERRVQVLKNKLKERNIDQTTYDYALTGIYKSNKKDFKKHFEITLKVKSAVEKLLEGFRDLNKLGAFEGNEQYLGPYKNVL